MMAVGTLAVALMAIALPPLAIWLPRHVVDTSGLTKAERLKAENDLRTTLVQAVGGTVLLIGVYFTWRRLSAAERSNEIASEGQITERFTRAIDQLGQMGDDKLHVRLGGIYALERIARESATDYGPVIEILTAFLRERTYQTYEGPGSGSREAQGVDKGPTKRPRLSPDIQAIITVLGRRSEEQRRQETRRLYLDGVDLRGGDLSPGSLSSVGRRFSPGAGGENRRDRPIERQQGWG